MISDCSIASRFLVLKHSESANLLRKLLLDGDEISAVRFDALMYGIELACLVGKNIQSKVGSCELGLTASCCVANIPEIGQKTELIPEDSAYGLS